MDIQASRRPWDPLELPEGPITRGRLKKFKEAVQGMMEINYEVPNSRVKLNIIQVCKGSSNGASKELGKECIMKQFGSQGRVYTEASPEGDTGSVCHTDPGMDPHTGSMYFTTSTTRGART